MKHKTNKLFWSGYLVVMGCLYLWVLLLWMGLFSAQAEQIRPITTTIQSTPATTLAKHALFAHETRVPYPTGLLCGMWAEIAVSAGWTVGELHKLDQTMWRESRCNPKAHNPRDYNGGSVGLMQVNQYWCKPSAYSKLGWLQDRGILKSCEQLYSPRTNLVAARAIFYYSFANHGDGWLPWRP